MTPTVDREIIVVAADNGAMQIINLKLVRHAVHEDGHITLHFSESHTVTLHGTEGHLLALSMAVRGVTPSGESAGAIAAQA